ncbi:FAD-dependent oxidoreductase [Pacificimonas sp. ICDLI1SI03]
MTDHPTPIRDNHMLDDDILGGDSLDVAIVGGGPAGQAAAMLLSGHGAQIAVFDEQARPGGQILRQPPTGFRVPDWLPGRTYQGLKRDLARFQQSGVAWHGEHSVLGIQGGNPFTLTMSGPDGVRTVSARRVLIAGGCQDLAVPMPGWTLPGVMTVGGLQAFVKSQRIVPDGPIVLAGTHPLMLVLAEQLLRAGMPPTAVIFAQSQRRMLSLLARAPMAALTGFGNLAAGAAAYRALRAAGVPVSFGDPLASLDGDTQVRRAHLASGRQFECRTVGLGYGFVPQAELFRQAGAETQAAGRAGGRAARADEWGETSVPGLFAAGEALGVAGAEAARGRGHLAGLGIARSLGLIGVGDAQTRGRSVRARLDRTLRFADLLDRLADPRPYFPSLTSSTFICRCEDVDLAAIDTAIAGGAATANSVKLQTRCGMGVCQGRNCEPTLLRHLASGGHPQDAGFASRFPARPVRLADLAGRDLC